jgi:hypothetical protein
MLDDVFVEALPRLMRMCLDAVYQPAPEVAWLNIPCALAEDDCA